MDSRPLILALAVAACTGPRPEAQVISVAPSPQPGDQRVTVSLSNRGGGHGEIELRVVLRGGGTEVSAEQTVELKAHEHLALAVDVPAPPGVYTATVTAEYPD